MFASLDLGKNTGSRALLLKTTKSIVQRLILFKFYFCHIRLPSLHRSENRNDFAHYKKKMYTILAKPLYTKKKGLVNRKTRKICGIFFNKDFIIRKKSV